MLIIGEALYEWGQGMHGKSVPSSHFCCKLKIALLKMSLKKIIKLNMELHGKCQSAIIWSMLSFVFTTLSILG